MGYGQWSTNGYGSTLRQSRADMAAGSKVTQRRFTFGDHANTCHVWAQQNRETWRGQSSDGRIRFKGATIYSYGSHFPMANFTARKFDGQRIVLINGAGYSVSTGKHKRLVGNALSGLDVCLVRVPDLAKLLGYNSGKELRALKLQFFNEACETYASAYRDTEAGRHWATPPRDARATVEALRAALCISRKIPGDILQWSDDRRAKFDAMMNARRLRQALGRIKAINPALPVADQFNPDTEAARECNAWNCRDRINQIENQLRDIGSARLTLGKAKRYPVMVRKASAALKAGRALRDKWRELQGIAAARESRATDLEKLEDVRGYMNATRDEDKAQEPRALWNYEETARLAGLAYSEGFADLGDYLRDNVSLKKWFQEVPDTFKVETYGREVLTPEQWQDGQGEASQHYGPLSSLTLLRKRGDELQTTRGARCPWSHAVKAFEIAQRCRATQETFTPNGHSIRVGTYSVDRIDPDGTLHAGCHHLDFAEMQRLAIREIPDRVRPCSPLPALREG